MDLDERKKKKKKVASLSRCWLRFLVSTMAFVLYNWETVREKKNRCLREFNRKLDLVYPFGLPPPYCFFSPVLKSPYTGSSISLFLLLIRTVTSKIFEMI